MGHCDSSASFGRHGRLCGADGRFARPDSSHAGSHGLARKELAASRRTAGSWILLALIQFYRTFLSPFFGGACKYYPSCSNYAAEAVARHGARRGLALALKRLGRCHPFAHGGFDPVPDLDETGSPVFGVREEERAG